MTNFPVMTRDELDTDQRRLWDALTLGPRGFYTGGAEAVRLPDLYNAWLQFPQFGEIVLQLGDAVRAVPEFTGRMREMVVLTTSVRLGAHVEFDFHVPFARNEGIPEDVIEAIRDGKAPPFSEPADRIIHEANLQFLDTATLTEATREEVLALIGHPGMIQLIAVITLYVLTAYTTNVACVQLAEDFSADPDELKAFFAARPGT